jgi:hypothetical protein
MVKKPAAGQQIVPLEVIERRIYLIREHKVMLDSDLAELYQVETFNLNKAVKTWTDFRKTSCSNSPKKRLKF